MYSIVFVEPESSGNIGSLARAMKNFGLNKLILVNPKCKIDGETKKFAKHAFEIVEKARILSDLSFLKEYDFVIGTTGKILSDYDKNRTYITPKELAKQVKAGKLALVFGRESIGLTNKELSLCDIVIHIPTNKEYPILNISHAAAILFYELFYDSESEVRKADKKEKDALFKYFEEILNDLDDIRDKKAISKIFKNVVNRSMIVGEEAHTLAGVFRKIKKKT